MMNIIMSNSDDFCSITSLIVTVFSIVLSVFLYILGKEKRIIVHQITSSFSLTSQILSYRRGSIFEIYGQPIEDITTSIIKFINSGNRTISSSDFAVLAPLGIYATGKFYKDDHFPQIKADNKNSDLQIKIIDEHTLNIEFDFLKPKESFSIAILHKGKISIRGELKSGEIQDHDNTNICLLPYGILCFLTITSLILFLPLDSGFMHGRIDRLSSNNYLLFCLTFIILLIVEFMDYVKRK